MQTHTIDSIKYWNYMFKAVASRERLTEFIVLNIEETDMDVNVSRAAARKKYRMVTCEVARQEDFGSNDRTFFVNTFLGNFLNPYDTVLGYDLEQMQLSELDDYENSHKKARDLLPDIVLVRKSFPKAKKRHQKRFWKLKRLEMEQADEGNIHKKKDTRDVDQDYFMQDIEEDPAMREHINMYKVSSSHHFINY